MKPSTLLKLIQQIAQSHFRRLGEYDDIPTVARITYKGPYTSYVDKLGGGGLPNVYATA